MNQLVRENITIQREEYDNNELRELFKENKFKIEIMDEKVGNEVGLVGWFKKRAPYKNERNCFSFLLSSN